MFTTYQNWLSIFAFLFNKPFIHENSFHRFYFFIRYQYYVL
jgi:hypothetical protein